MSESQIEWVWRVGLALTIVVAPLWAMVFGLMLDFGPRMVDTVPLVIAITLPLTPALFHRKTGQEG